MLCLSCPATLADFKPECSGRVERLLQSKPPPHGRPQSRAAPVALAGWEPGATKLRGDGWDVVRSEGLHQSLPASL